MIRETVNALLACIVTFALCAVAYPAAAWGLGRFAFPSQAEGSLIARDGKVIGSELIGQSFASDRYFHPRPSAAGSNGYDASAASGSNLGTKNPALRERIEKSASELGATSANLVPADLVTASGSGLDPHISPESAHFQAARVAAARNLPSERVRSLIDAHTETSGAIIGAPARVNVLLLNLALDREKPPAVAGPSARRLEMDALSKRLDDLQAQVKAKSAPRWDPAALKALEMQVSRIEEAERDIPERIEGLDARINQANQSLRSLRSEVGEARATLKAVESKATRRPGSAAPAARLR